jgi:tetratricopeptide (TPR) repeat protein
MPDTPHDVHLDLAEFDRAQLPEGQRALQGDAFRQAVREHLSGEFLRESGAAEVVVTEDRIIMRWSATAKGASLTDQGIDYLKQGNYEKGVSTLRVALRRNPTDADALFNLALALSNKGNPDEAVELLQRLLAEQPAHAGAWVALGVAQASQGANTAAIESLRSAVALDPQNGYAQMNLGAILSRAGHAADGVVHCQQATQLLPSDPQAWLNLAMGLEETGSLDAAAAAYNQVLVLDPTGQLAQRAEEGRSRIAGIAFRNRGGDLRPDALSHCLGALQMFQGMPEAELKRLVYEIVMLGSRGLKVNDPAEQYTLRSLPGKFSGLHLLCIEYVGLKLIDPSADIGFDLSAEYEEACRQHENR